MDSARLFDAGRDAMLAGGVLLTPDFITPEEQAALLGWSETMAPHLTANGPNRRFSRVEALPTIDPIYEQVRRRVEALFDLSDAPSVETRFGLYLSIIAAGGAVHEHRDRSPAGTRHLRCNLFLQLPEQGGRPIVLDKPIDVAPRMLLAFYPSEMRHASEQVTGDRRRILLSFGYTVPTTHRLPRLG